MLSILLDLQSRRGSILALEVFTRLALPLLMDGANHDVPIAPHSKNFVCGIGLSDPFVLSEDGLPNFGIPLGTPVSWLPMSKPQPCTKHGDGRKRCGFHRFGSV